ncbi:hypothetical protein [Mesorhizobium sp. M7A.F.Ca.US.006.01.1.1]|uniref:hypothetical protein n=1 Tax=Mesorhizobium sp. M7A.F.Ca.US.006.01.1.1 TaxID=2496707 RepID=UPI001FDFD505|nr:hypothetical protein [Mesorhizobium sp. M7A.F.Ca.US.006.01.1.1]
MRLESSREATVSHQHLAGNVSRSIAGEKQRWANHVAKLGPTADSNVLTHEFVCLRPLFKCDVIAVSTKPIVLPPAVRRKRQEVFVEED